MFIWDVEGLKRELAGGLSQSACLRYLLAVLLAPWALDFLVALPGLLVSVPESIELSQEQTESARQTSRLYFLGQLLRGIALFAGVVFCYRRNGGTTGHHLLPRFVALAWVCGLRVTVGFIAPLYLLSNCVIVASTENWIEGISIQMLVISPLATALILWRVGIHLGAIKVPPLATEPAS